jgi:hypothetical protein
MTGGAVAAPCAAVGPGFRLAARDNARVVNR